MAAKALEATLAEKEAAAKKAAMRAKHFEGGSHRTDGGADARGG